MHKKIALIPGDGIGPEIIGGAVDVLGRIAQKFGHSFEYKEYDAGGAAIDKYGAPLPGETLLGCREADGILFGAVGGPKWENLGDIRPEQALLGLRGGLGLYANLRPAILFDQLRDACPLKPSLIEGGLDILIVRELTGGIYFGESGRSEDGESAYDTESYTAAEIERVVRRAISAARARSGRLTLVDKANILETSRLWREVFAKVMRGEADIEFDMMYVDNAAMQLIRDPRRFDVIVTSNMFGDILSDEASQLTGSIGMLPSASLGDGGRGLYEPVHGSAPDIAGEGKANPLAMILSAAMMLRYSFGLSAEAAAVEAAVCAALDMGLRTADIMSPGKTPCNTEEMIKAVADCI